MCHACIYLYQSRDSEFVHVVIQQYSSKVDELFILDCVYYCNNCLFDAFFEDWLKHALTHHLAHLPDGIRVASSIILRTCQYM